MAMDTQLWSFIITVAAVYGTIFLLFLMVDLLGAIIKWLESRWTSMSYRPKSNNPIF
jgi:hypothetical protein